MNWFPRWAKVGYSTNPERMAVHAHSDRGEAGQQSGRLFWPLLGAIVAGSAGTILAAV